MGTKSVDVKRIDCISGRLFLAKEGGSDRLDRVIEHIIHQPASGVGSTTHGTFVRCMNSKRNFRLESFCKSVPIFAG